MHHSTLPLAVPVRTLNTAVDLGVHPYLHAGIHETQLADIAATIGGSLAGEWFEDYIGSAAMAVAAGIVIAQV